jgi:hypothetical protein
MSLARALRAITVLSPAVEARVLSAFGPLSLERGQRLARAGDVCGGIAFVERGLLASLSLASSREASCDLFAEGDFATDYVSLLTVSRRRWTWWRSSLAA